METRAVATGAVGSVVGLSRTKSGKVDGTAAPVHDGTFLGHRRPPQVQHLVNRNHHIVCCDWEGR